MTMERAFDDNPLKAKTRRSRGVEFARGFFGWFVVMGIAGFILNLFGSSGGAGGGMICGLFLLYVLPAASVITALVMLARRRWFGMGILGALALNLLLGFLLGISLAYTATPIFLSDDFGVKLPNLFVNISAMTMNQSFAPAPADDAAVAALAQSGVTTNAEWTPYTQDFDGVTMVLVPVGCYAMGSDEYARGDNYCFEAPFWIDLTEVNGAQFSQFNGHAVRASETTDPNLPRGNVTWYEAKLFCAARGSRLPTEAEWEYAARGPDNLLYPWGNDFHDARAGSPSWVGAESLRGGVDEWTSTWFREMPYDATDGREASFSFAPFASRVIHGTEFFTQSSSRVGRDPADTYPELGLRCIRPY